MELNVLYFAHVRARTGCATEVLSVPDACTADQAVAVLVAHHPSVEALLPAVRIAVDGEFVTGDHIMTPGAELVLIPPVAGGAGPSADAVASKPLTGATVDAVRITSDVLGDDTVAALSALVSDDRFGAVSTFTGVVRNHARGQTVTGLEYEAYESMARKQLAAIVTEVEGRFNEPGREVRCAVHHRVGVLDIGDVAVVVAAGSPHRAEAFDACRLVIDRLKEDVPIWKREAGEHGEVWVSDRP